MSFKYRSAAVSFRRAFRTETLVGDFIRNDEQKQQGCGSSDGQPAKTGIFRGCSSIKIAKYQFVRKSQLWMGNELFCCSDEKSPAANSGLVSSKERRRGMLPLQSITEVTSVSEQPTIKILLPTPTAHQRHTGKSLPSEHDRLRDSCLSNSKSERPNKCRPHVAR